MGNHEYETFEDSLHRWGAAERLIETLIARIDDPWLDRWNPSDAQVDVLIDGWFSPEVVVCQDKHSGACPGPEHCHRRCTIGYWRVHGEDVAKNMAALARVLGENERLWRIVGRIHDVDYPRHPHHEASVSSEESHPMALATQLTTLGAPPAAVLAILSHAPHLRLRPSSPLAWALLTCDEHATMTAFAKKNPEMEPAYPPPFQELASVLTPASSTIAGGYYRKDMQGRASLGLKMLLEYKHRAIPSFDRDKFRERIDWDTEIEAMGVQHDNS